MQSLSSNLMQMAKAVAISWSAPSTFHSGSQQTNVVYSDCWRLPFLSASTQTRYASTMHSLTRCCLVQILLKEMGCAGGYPRQQLDEQVSAHAQAAHTDLRHPVRPGGG